MNDNPYASPKAYGERRAIPWRFIERVALASIAVMAGSGWLAFGGFAVIGARPLSAVIPFACAAWLFRTAAEAHKGAMIAYRKWRESRNA